VRDRRSYPVILKQICCWLNAKLNSVTSILLSSQPIKWCRMCRTSMFRVCASSVSLVRLKEKPDYYVSLVHKSWMKIRASPSLAFIIILKIINHGLDYKSRSSFWFTLPRCWKRTIHRSLLLSLNFATSRNRSHSGVVQSRIDLYNIDSLSAAINFIAIS